MCISLRIPWAISSKNLSEAVQQLLACVLTEMKEVSQGDGARGAFEQKQAPHLLPIEEWRPAQDEDVKQAIVTRRTQRNERYQQIMALRAQGLTSAKLTTLLLLVSSLGSATCAKALSTCALP